MESSTYRMIVASGYDYVDTGARADELLRRRLGEQCGYDSAALGPGRTALAPGVLLDADSAAGREGAYTRWRLRESTAAGAGLRQTTLVLHSREHGAAPGSAWKSSTCRVRRRTPAETTRRSSPPRCSPNWPRTTGRPLSAPNPRR